MLSIDCKCLIFPALIADIYLKFPVLLFRLNSPGDFAFIFEAITCFIPMTINQSNVHLNHLSYY